MIVAYRYVAGCAQTQSSWVKQGDCEQVFAFIILYPFHFENLSKIIKLPPPQVWFTLLLTWRHVLKELVPVSFQYKKQKAQASGAGKSSTPNDKVFNTWGKVAQSEGIKGSHEPGIAEPGTVWLFPSCVAAGFVPFLVCTVGRGPVVLLVGQRCAFPPCLWSTAMILLSVACCAPDLLAPP